MKDAAVNRLATSITQLTQVTTSQIPTKLLDKACQKLQGIQSVPSQRVTDLEAAIRQIRQLSCILDSCTISASYEVSQAQKALLLLPHTAKGASTSSEEPNAQISPRTDDEYNLPTHEDQLPKHYRINVNSKPWQPSQCTGFGTLPNKQVLSWSSTRNYPRVG